MLEALAEVFRSNRLEAGPGAAPEALAALALARLLDPVSCRLADVGGLRLHLALAGDLSPDPACIHISLWDEDAEVWRPLAEVELGPAASEQ